MNERPKYLSKGQIWGHRDECKYKSLFLIYEDGDGELRGLWLENSKSYHMCGTNYVILPTDIHTVSDHEYLGLLGPDWANDLLGELSHD